MRYIGNKVNILDKIHAILQANGVDGKSFFDLFSGTANVAKFFKHNGFQVYSCDVMYLSYCLQKAYIENNDTPQFSNLLPRLGLCGQNLFAEPLDLVIEHLNGIKPVKGFIYTNYTPDGTASLPQPRMYFSSANGAKIDAIRIAIEAWKKQELISSSEYFILLACLIESVSFYANVAGVYAAFHKKWDPRAVKPFALRRIELINNGKSNHVFCANSMSLIDKIDVDILYLDPPYNARQYLPNYHLIETIAAYDNPQIKGVTGMRCDNSKKSDFCNAKKALACLSKIAQEANYKYLVMSYNSEGIMAENDILTTLSAFGEVKLEQFEHARFKSNNNGLARTKKTVFEQLYILKKQ